jgi:hypothetical protein
MVSILVFPHGISLPFLCSFLANTNFTAMSNYKNPYLKDNEKRYNFVPHLKFKKVKQVSRTRYRQLLRGSIPLAKLLEDTGNLSIH